MKGDTLLDVGSNVGIFVDAAKLDFDPANIVAFLRAVGFREVRHKAALRRKGNKGPGLQVNGGSRVRHAPRSCAERRRRNSRLTSRQIETRIRRVATARIVGLICSRRPENICLGIVR